MNHQISPLAAISMLWALWIVSWMVAAAWSDRAVRRAGARREILYNVVTVIGMVLLFGFYRLRHYHIAVWQVGRRTAWCMVGLAAIGFSFTWWARVHLGRLWSRWVVSKTDHRIIQSGPYALVRHPIYTGISLAMLATAVMFGTLAAYCGALLIILGFYLKARVEERFLKEELGAETYDIYARRVPMLVPFLRI